MGRCIVIVSCMGKILAYLVEIIGKFVLRVLGRFSFLSIVRSFFPLSSLLTSPSQIITIIISQQRKGQSSMASFKAPVRTDKDKQIKSIICKSSAMQRSACA